MAKKKNNTRALGDLTPTSEQALIKFNDGNVLKINYTEATETLEVKNTSNGKGGTLVLGGADLSYIPTINITFEIHESLGNENTLNLLRNTFRMVKRQPSAEFQLYSTYAPVEPAATGTILVENVMYRYTGSAYITYADFTNLNGLTVEASNLINCTRSSGATSNINIIDQSKDASITLTVSAPAGE